MIREPIAAGDRVRPCFNGKKPGTRGRLSARSYVVGCRHRPAGRLMLDLVDPETGKELHGVASWVRVWGDRPGRDRHFIGKRDAEIARIWDMTHP